MRRQQSGEATIIVLLTLAVLGLGFLAFKPKSLDGDSRRAKESTESTAQVVSTTKQGGHFITQGLNRATNPRPDDSWLTRDNYQGRATGRSTLAVYAPEKP